MLTQIARRQDRGLNHRQTVAKWMVLSSPFACALGYLLLR